ncbi:hypothetical protein [Aneurinibacillus terranovensis]|uniref:hypothetical protein n=1 Tax=Aneurinibacillus terranovensis TaxID=278991 RepID=UPI000418FE89|nr:hypothetical protein [Aneurinibacillus terranovensis]
MKIRKLWVVLLLVLMIISWNAKPAKYIKNNHSAFTQQMILTLNQHFLFSFWCVLFPPLCAGDIVVANDARNVQDKTPKKNDIKIRFFIWDFLKNVSSEIFAPGQQGQKLAKDGKIP